MNDAEAQFAARTGPVCGLTGKGCPDFSRIAQSLGCVNPGGQFGVKRNRIAVQPQHERCGDGLRGATPPKRCGDGQRGDQMGCVAMSVKQPVQHSRPGHITLETQRKSFFFREAMFVRQDRQASVDQWQEPDFQLYAHEIMFSLLLAHQLMRGDQRFGDIGDALA